MICSSGPGQLSYFWRDSGPTFTWNGPFSLPITRPGGRVGRQLGADPEPVWGAGQLRAGHPRERWWVGALLAQQRRS